MAKKALQLYSLRETITENIPKTLTEVKAAGYDGVETAGTYDLSAKEFRKMTDDAGLEIYGGHIGWEMFDEAQIKNTIEFYKTLGAKYLTCPGIDEKCFNDIDSIKKTAEMFNEVGETVAKYGCVFGYHNHYIEMHRINDVSKLEILFKNCNPEYVTCQYDTGNAFLGGGDADEVLDNLKDYCNKIIHYKDIDTEGNDSIVGEGVLNFSDITKKALRNGIEIFIVEQESFKKDPVESVTACCTNLNSFLNE